MLIHPSNCAERDVSASPGGSRRDVQISLTDHGKDGSLGIAVPRAYGGVGGRLTDLFCYVAELAQRSPSAAVAYAVQRQFIEVLLSARNAALCEYRIPGLIDGSVSGACGATWHSWDTVSLAPVVGRDVRPGLRLNGEICAIPNVVPHCFLISAAVRFQPEKPLAAVLLSSEDDGIERCARDLEGYERANRARVSLSDVIIREEEILDDDGHALSRAVRGVTMVLRCALAAGVAKLTIGSMEERALRDEQTETLGAAVRDLESLTGSRMALSRAGETGLTTLHQRFLRSAWTTAWLHGGAADESRLQRVRAKGLLSV